MNKFYVSYCVTLSIILYWNTLLFVQLNDHTFVVSPYFDACYLIHRQQTPTYVVLRKSFLDDFTEVNEEFTLNNCNQTAIGAKWSLTERPIVGDHIHMGMVLSVNNHVYNFHDRNMSEPIPYETAGTCPQKGNYSYEKRWYHTGIHTHCDGNIIHVHPWSAPNQLRVEGRSVKLKLWFESVGMEVSPNKTALKLPGDTHYISNWNMEYYVNVEDVQPSYQTNSIEEMINFWLVDHHGEFLLWSGGNKPRKDYRVLNYKSHPINYPKRYMF